MSHRYLSMTRKRNAKVFSGRVQHHQDRKKRGCPSPKSSDVDCFFDVRGIVHTEFMPQGHTINQHIYRDVLRRLMRSVHEKRRELYEKKSWLLHHDNAPVHNALSIREFLAKNNIAVLEQLPYSPDLAPCDFFLFPKFKGVMKETRFPDVQAIKRAVTKELRAIPKKSFQECMEAWQRRMEKCVRAHGDHFEGDA